MTGELRALLAKELKLLDDAADVVRYSFTKCTGIGTKADYSLDELDSFESLCSRFARLSDIITQKVFRLIDELALESHGSVRDRINRAEKRGIIESAETFVAIRMLRNDIAHEYLPEAIRNIFKKVMTLTPPLLSSVAGIKEYCAKSFENQ